jgi:hypothetical protein
MFRRIVQGFIEAVVRRLTIKEAVVVRVSSQRGQDERRRQFADRGRDGLLVGLAVLMVTTLISGCSGAKGDHPAPDAETSTSGTSPDQPANPDSPVRCSSISLCFPPSVTGPQFLDRVHQNDRWTCTKRGGKDIYGEVVDLLDQGICQKNDGKSQPYIQKAGIAWDTDTHQPTGTLASVNVSASTQYREFKGETANPQNTLTLAPVVFNVAMKNLWPDNTSLQQEANRALGQVLPKCADLQSKQKDREVLISTGYKISCSDLAPISIKYPEGTLTTITVLMRFAVPSVREWPSPTGR